MKQCIRVPTPLVVVENRRALHGGALALFAESRDNREGTGSGQPS
jgi:hypothetical protein